MIGSTASAVSPRALLAELASSQAGAVSRPQVLALGYTDAWIAAQLAARRWQRSQPGVYVSFTGPLPALTQVWAALLYAGPGAVASHRTAAWLQGLEDTAPRVVSVTISGERKVRRQAGLDIHRCLWVAKRTHPAKRPSQTRVEETVLDLVDDERRADDVVGWVTRACQRRRTTADRIAKAAAERARLRWRALLNEIVADVGAGVLSALERRWRRRVERAHGLPRGAYNIPESDGRRRLYRDVRYARWRVVVELDGRAAHPDELAHRDRIRDNRVVMTDRAPLRYGWPEVASDPCGCAIQVAQLLALRGWSGALHRCVPSCTVPTP